ncbi:hypothetical protein [Halioglobus sp. HI00S01]|uniref:hypothetical protein n=1 Tax=Halioglobus sp. HI00S01 TaxID=1822214 RepID=UPI0012E875E9|nr:hypothetical protein [Halioglobus sp. HI00S01]
MPAIKVGEAVIEEFDFSFEPAEKQLHTFWFAENLFGGKNYGPVEIAGPSAETGDPWQVVNINTGRTIGIGFKLDF